MGGSCVNETCTELPTPATPASCYKSTEGDSLVHAPSPIARHFGEAKARYRPQDQFGARSQCSMQTRRILQAALAQGKPWLRRKGVVAIGLGQARRAGDWSDETAHIVVKMEWKLDGPELGRTRRPALPRFIEVTVHGRKHRVPVDVQGTQGQRAGQLHGCVGTAVTIRGKVRGGTGAVVSSAQGPRLLIAGHVGGQNGVAIRAGGIQGKTEKTFITSQLDHCLVAPGAPPPAGWATLVDDTPLSGVARVDDLTLGQTLYFHHSETGQRVPVVLRHLDMTAPFEYPDGIHRVQHLLGTDGESVPGDSGTLLYDASFAAVGTLVGMFHDESYFIPCERAFNLLGLGLIT